MAHKCEMFTYLPRLFALHTLLLFQQSVSKNSKQSMDELIKDHYMVHKLHVVYQDDNLQAQH